MNTLTRLRLAIGSLFGSADARESQAALRRLDAIKQWRDFTFTKEAAFRADLAALEQFGGAERGPEATRLREQLDAAERDLDERLRRAYEAVDAGQPAQAAAEATALESSKDGAAAALQSYRTLAEAHLSEQREAWDVLATSTAAARAGLLAQQLVALPEIPELPKPDVSAFVEPYERAQSLVPAAYQEGESNPVCFDASEVRRLAEAAVGAAPEAEATLTRYLYDVARGYEAALGKERAAALLQTLRDPTAVRDLRAQRPELAYAAGPSGVADLLPLLMVTSLFAAHSPSWQMPEHHAGGAAGGTSTGAGVPGAQAGTAGGGGLVGAPPEIGSWLDSLGVPPAAELAATFAASEVVDDMGDDAQTDDDDSGGDGGDLG